MRRWIVAGALAVTALTVAGASATPHSRTVSCPRSALPFTANSIAPASRAALAREKPSSRPQVTGANTAPADVQRGAMAKVECGTRVWRRTSRALPSPRAGAREGEGGPDRHDAGRVRGGRPDRPDRAGGRRLAADRLRLDPARLGSAPTSGRCQYLRQHLGEGRGGRDRRRWHRRNGRRDLRLACRSQERTDRAVTLETPWRRV